MLIDLSAWEASAALLAIGYLLLATRENQLCWYCAFASTAIYTALFWNVSLLMDSALNVYYMGMAIYGWQQWRYGGLAHDGIAINALSLERHAIIFGSIAILTLVSGYLLSEHTTAAWPYVDSFTTWGSVITTVMVAKKILENWLYWVVLDAVSIPLYIERGLHLTALLFFAYTIIAVGGYVTWRRRYHSGR
ncbi:MAG: nicotinamide riboside transporter PnuC [Proteobacteria bacterium]|nr:nicotinamide riboside transporter PnuC [Pseudomonadota bacterium]